MPSPLANARHEAFAQARAKGMSADSAYAAAGYRPNRSNAAQLNAKQHVRARVAEITARGAARAEIDIARTLTELGRLGFSDIRRLMDANGNLKPIHDLDDDIAAAVASIEVVSRPVGKNPDGSTEIEYVHKVKLWPKNAALDTIAKHLGMLVDRTQHDVTDAFAQAIAEISRRGSAVPVASQRRQDDED